MNWKRYLPFLVIIPNFALLTSCYNSNFNKTKNGNSDNQQIKFTFYKDNESYEESTYYLNDNVDNDSFINAFTKSNFDNDCYFYNAKIVKDIKDGKIVSVYKLTKSIREYFDFNVANKEYITYKDKLKHFKDASIEFLNSMVLNANNDMNFHEIGMKLGEVIFSLAESRTSVNYVQIDKISQIHLQNLNSIFNTKFNSLREIPSEYKNYDVYKLQNSAYEHFVACLTKLNYNHRTFAFLNDKKALSFESSIDYYNQMQTILCIKRMYYELIYTFDYLHIFDKCLEIGNWNQLPSEEISKARQLGEKDEMIYLARKQNASLTEFYKTWRKNLYKMITPNNFFGYVIVGGKKESILWVDFIADNTDLNDIYSPFDFVNWIYNYEDNNLNSFMEEIINEEDFSQRTFWEKTFTENTRKNELLKKYLKQKLKTKPK